MMFTSALTEARGSKILYEDAAWVPADDLIAAGSAAAAGLATASALVCRSASAGTIITAALAAERLGVNVTFVDPRLRPESLGIEIGAAPPAGPPGITAERLPPGSVVLGLFRRTGYSFLSSGSTAAPTRVVRPAEVTAADVRQIAHAVYTESGDVALATPGFHSYGFSHLAAAVVSGCRIHAVRPNATAARLSAAVAADGTQVLVGLPSHLDLVAGSRSERAFTSLRTIVSSAGRLGADTVGRSLAAGLPLHNAYGSTETGTVAIGDLRTVTDPVGYVGPPLPGVKVRLDGTTRSGHRVLEIRTSALATGIVGGDHRVTTPAVDGWYRTGDVAKVSGPGIWLLGRQAEFLKVSGIRVSCPRIREIVLRHPSVADVEVFGVTDRMRGEVAACRVVLTEDLRLEELQYWCRGLLQPEEIPRAMDVVDRIRRSATGKALHEG